MFTLWCFPQEAGSEETQLLRQLLTSHKRASYSGWEAQCPPPLDPSPSRVHCHVGAVLSAVAFPSICLLFQKEHGSSLAYQWSGLGTFCGPGPVPGPGTKIPQAVRRSQEQTAAARPGVHRSLSEGPRACETVQCNRKPSVCGRLQCLRVLEKICEVQ